MFWIHRQLLQCGEAVKPHPAFYIQWENALGLVCPVPLSPQVGFNPPKDLAIHLAHAQALPHSPLILPSSQLHFGLWVKYGILFPYKKQAIINLAQVVVLPASFIDFHPFKGYFDLSFTCEADAATAATVLLVFKGTTISTTRTWLPTDTTMVVQFSGLPTHLPLQCSIRS
ncbi:hypothetical protein L0F63_001756 [Massospora cicadina]|nr:hypothetical protein L0F63_001756 [Massospora cicadina]